MHAWRVFKCVVQSLFRGVGSGWAGWAHAHPDFGQIEGAAGQRRRGAPHYYLPTQIFRLCYTPVLSKNVNNKKRAPKSVIFDIDN